jgi:hypothetical protein
MEEKQVQSHPLSAEQLQETANEVMEACEKLLPGKTKEEKKQWCIGRLRQMLEAFDNYVPVIGLFLDNPVVDDLEAQAIELFVDWMWNKINPA